MSFAPGQVGAAAIPRHPHTCCACSYFFVSCNRGFEGLGPDAARVDSLLAQHGLSAPEPWLPGLITAACEDMQSRQHPFRKELWTTEVAQHPVADDL